MIWGAHPLKSSINNVHKREANTLKVVGCPPFKVINLKKNSQDFYYLDKKPLTRGCLLGDSDDFETLSLGETPSVYIPYGKSRLQGFGKVYVGRLFSGYLKYLLSWGFWGRG